jgi:hypothetical protein
MCELVQRIATQTETEQQDACSVEKKIFGIVFTGLC